MLYQLSYFRLINKKSGESKIRTYEGVRQQIYSLPHLATLVSPQAFAIFQTSRQRDSNPRPADYKSAALANWALSLIHIFRAADL